MVSEKLISRRGLIPLVMVVLVTAGAGGCDALWPDEGRYDPRRCSPACPSWQVCKDGICEVDVYRKGPNGAPWRVIPAGVFSMGSPLDESCRQENEVQHTVTLEYPFEIAATEVTQQAYDKLMETNPSDNMSSGVTYPVENVTWHQAAQYCNKLSDISGLPQCYHCTTKEQTCATSPSWVQKNSSIYSCPGYRLPTEAEWEYAYRATGEEATYMGSLTSCEGTVQSLNHISWYAGNSGGTSHPVGQKQTNGLGLYDMAGNVWEWCHDKYHLNLGTTATTNPVKESNDQTDRVIRGGGFMAQPRYLRAAQRKGISPAKGKKTVGFRCVRRLRFYDNFAEDLGWSRGFPLQIYRDVERSVVVWNASQAETPTWRSARLGALMSKDVGPFKDFELEFDFYIASKTPGTCTLSVGGAVDTISGANDTFTGVSATIGLSDENGGTVSTTVEQKGDKTTSSLSTSGPAGSWSNYLPVAMSRWYRVQVTSRKGISRVSVMTMEDQKIKPVGTTVLKTAPPDGMRYLVISSGSKGVAGTCAGYLDNVVFKVYPPK